MRMRLLRCGLLVTLTLSLGACAVTERSERVAGAAAVPLADTQWSLATLAGRMLGNDGPAITLQLQSQNPRITGFAGCNRMFGGYLLDGDQLKFDQVGATKMACLEEARMQLEQDYFQMLTQVAGWKIDGSTLLLLDAGGATLATFIASTPSPAR